MEATRLQTTHLNMASEYVPRRPNNPYLGVLLSKNPKSYSSDLPNCFSQCGPNTAYALLGSPSSPKRVPQTQGYNAMGPSFDLIRGPCSDPQIQPYAHPSYGPTIHNIDCSPYLGFLHTGQIAIVPNAEQGPWFGIFPTV